MWHVFGRVPPYVSKDHTAFVFKVKQSFWTQPEIFSFFVVFGFWLTDWLSNFLNREEGTDMLSRNIGTELPLNAA
jgi:hypothetical protein